MPKKNGSPKKSELNNLFTEDRKKRLDGLVEKALDVVEDEFEFGQDEKAKVQTAKDVLDRASIGFRKESEGKTGVTLNLPPETIQSIFSSLSTMFNLQGPLQDQNQPINVTKTNQTEGGPPDEVRELGQGELGQAEGPNEVGQPGLGQAELSLSEVGQAGSSRSERDQEEEESKEEDLEEDLIERFKKS